MGREKAAKIGCKLTTREASFAALEKSDRTTLIHNFCPSIGFSFNRAIFRRLNRFSMKQNTDCQKDFV